MNQNENVYSVVPNGSNQNRFIHVLKNSAFLKLWISQVLSIVAVHMINFTLIIQAFELSGKTIAVSFLWIVVALPGILVGMPAGVLSDRWDRKKILVATNFLQAATILIYLLVLDNLALLYAIAFVNAIIAQTYIPSEAAALPTIVPKEQYIAANTIFMLSNIFGFIIGSALAGPIVAYFNLATPFYVSSVMLLLAGLTVVFLPSLKPSYEKKFQGVIYTIVSDTVDLWIKIKTKFKLRWAIVRLASVFIVLAIFAVIFPSFVKNGLGFKVTDLSLFIVVPGGIGFLLGGIIVERLELRISKRLLFNSGMICAGLFIVALSLFSIYPFAKHLPIPQLLMFFLGIFGASVTTPIQTIIQEEAEEEIRGRVFALVNFFYISFSILATLFLGLFADLIGSKFIILLVGLSMVVAGSRNFIRRYE